MMPRSKSPPLVAAQAGMSLFPALMFLFVLAVIGVSALNSTLMQEKMVSNTKDANIAFQAAEAGLRDAEADVVRNIGSGTVFSSSCSNGLCTPPSTWSTPTSMDISKAIDWSNTALTRSYGVYTASSPLSGVAAQPQYVIERLSTLPVGPGGSVGLGVGAPNSGGAAYRLTVLATGLRPETRVILQSTYLVSNTP